MKLNLNDPNVWENWRKNYDTLSYEEQQAFHNAIEKVYPEQKHYSYDDFKEVIILTSPQKIIEIGGWKGDLANEALLTRPEILFWINIEICEEAVNKTRCLDPRFFNQIPESFDWFKEKREIEADLVVATHFIEHLSNEHFKEMVEHFDGVKYMYFEAPLSTKGEKWKGFEGTHKLTYGWRDVIDIMLDKGYKLVYSNGICKLFEK